MIILPAIDIKDGRCVRLLKGEFSTVHQVADSAYDTAKSFLSAGASIIHVVDLDGALNGRISNMDTIKEIMKSGAKVELGGGIRDLQTIEDCLNQGIFRVILGSAALKNPVLVKEAVRLYQEKIAVGIDAKDGYVSIEGWKSQSDSYFTDFAKTMEEIGASNIIFTDISKDGTLAGPNLAQLLALKEAVSCDITASGGIRDMKNIKDLCDMGLYGAIAGKSVYSGTLNLKEAVDFCRNRGRG